MKRINLSSVTNSWVATLAVIGMTALAPLPSTQAIELDPLNTQTSEILVLLSAVHELTSYNGNADTRAQHLAAWEQLWAQDSTFTINNGVPIVGRDAIMAFFGNAGFFNNSWVGLSPSFRTEVAIDGNTAEVYLECIFLNESKAVVLERALSGTVRKIEGKWRFWHMNNDPAAPLF